MMRTTDSSRLLTLFSTRAGEDEIDEDEANYIVQFHDEVEDFLEISNEIAEVLGKKATHVFKKLIHGCVISGITKKVADKIASIPQVKRVEKDEKASALAGVDGKGRRLQLDAQEIPWGITRVNGGRTYTGTNIAFILDVSLSLFEGFLTAEAHLTFPISIRLVLIWIILILTFTQHYALAHSMTEIAMMTMDTALTLLAPLAPLTMIS
jgi:hypothetical protein